MEDIEIWQHGIVKGHNIKPFHAALHHNVLNHYEGHEIEYCIRLKKRKTTLASHA